MLPKSWLAGIATFVFGLSLAYTPVTKTSLEEISNNIEQYEGRLVEVETFAQFDEVFDWRIGEPFEKAERTTFLKISNESALMSRLKNELSANWSGKQFNRVKVRARGILNDNCNDGVTCCVGQSMTLEDASVTVIGPVTKHSNPFLD